MRIFTGGTYCFAMNYFSECTRSPLALGLYNRLFIDSLGFMGVNKLKGTSNYLAEIKKNIETDSQFFLKFLYDKRSILLVIMRT